MQLSRGFRHLATVALAQRPFTLRVVVASSALTLLGANPFQAHGMVPSLSSISSGPVRARGQGFTLVVTGRDFSSKSVTQWNGSRRATAFVSSTQLRAKILSSDIKNLGTDQIAAYDPGPNGGKSNALRFTVVAFPLQITATTLPNGKVGVAYNGTLSPTGGTPPYSWNVASGNLPSGLSLSASGTISGTPMANGSYGFTLQVMDSEGNEASRAYSVSISGKLQAGCGAFTDNSLCGNVGDPYEGHGPPPNQQPISACTTITTGSTNYKLTGNIGTDPTAACIQVTYNVNDITVDLGGYTITGAIFDYSSGDGSTIFNGTVTCNVVTTGAYPHSCVDTYFNYGGGAPTTAQYRLHHLTVNQQNQNGLQLEIEADEASTYSGGGTGRGMPCRIDHITVDSNAISPAPDGTNNRYGGIYDAGIAGVAGSGCNVEMDDNYIHCGGGLLNNCQGMGVSPAEFAYMHNNEVLMDNLVDAQSSRGAICDAQAGVNGTCDVYHNYFLVNHNRAVRYRICTTGIPCTGTQTGLVYNNEMLNIQQGGRVAAIHIGETDVALEQANIRVYENTLELNPSTAGGAGTPGNGIVVAGAEGVIVHNNAVTCYGGDCTGAGYVLLTDTWPYAGGVTSVTIKNMTLPSGWGSNAAVEACGPGNPTEYNCTDDLTNGVATVNYCNTGTLVGNGVMTESCP
jgi:hypothetical protein